MKNKLIALTMGDAAGIGPEIIVKTFADSAFMSEYPAFVIGDVGVFQRQVEASGLPLEVCKISSVSALRPRAGIIEVLSPGASKALPADLAIGEVSALAGQAAFDAIYAAIGLAMRREISGICTAPIHKEALAAACVPYPGHTEMLADFSATQNYAMMLVNSVLRTILVTVHCSMQDAISRISIERELRIIRLAHQAMLDLGITNPRVAVAGLNPHAGEGGMFGWEDIDLIAPAIAQARAEGIDASGPWPGDTVFMNACRGRFDIVVAQYHDQGLIPVKLGGVEDGVNITVGLPFVRTSPDHGTAFDIAGKGIANPASLKLALQSAHHFSRSNHPQAANVTGV